MHSKSRSLPQTWFINVLVYLGFFHCESKLWFRFQLVCTYPPRLRGSRYCCPLHSRWPRSPALGKGWSTGCHFWKQFGKSSQVFSKHTNNHVTSGICLMTSKFIALQTQLCTHGTKCLSVTTKLPGYWLLHLPNMWDAEFLGWHPSPHELKIYLIN